MTNFNIHTFKLDDYKTDLFKSELEKGNEFFKFIEQMLDPKTFILDDKLSKYFKTNNSGKSLNIDFSKDFRNIIENTNINSVIKNRLLETKTKTNYFLKDNLNMIRVDLEKGVKENSDQIFSGLSYKNFETFGKMIRNLFLMNLLVYRTDGIIKLHKKLKVICASSCNNIVSTISYDKPYADIFTDDDKLNLEIWVEDFLKKIKLNKFDNDSLLAIFNSFGMNNNFVKKMYDRIQNNNIRFSYFEEYNNLEYFICRFDYVYQFFTRPFSSISNYFNYVRLFTDTVDLSINNIINKVFEYNSFVNSKLNKLSYTKTEKRTNPVSGFISEHNIRVAFDKKDEQEVEKLAKEVNKLSMFQQELANNVSIKLMKHKKENSFHFEEVSGNAMLYYYNVTNYENSGCAQSIYKYGNIFNRSIQNLSGFNHLRSKDGELFNSCMRNPCNQINIKWYANNKNCSLLILTNDNKTKIRGRAIVWTMNGKKYVDRVFTNGNEASLSFAEYINKSNLIPIYSYSSISPAKEAEKREWRDSDYKLFKFSQEDITFFGAQNPFMDTMRSYKFVYNPNDKIFRLSETLRSDLKSVYYDTCCHDINIVSKEYSSCCICGNNGRFNKLIKLRLNGKDNYYCNHHISKNEELFGNKSILLDQYNKLLNVTSNYGFTTIDYVEKIDNIERIAESSTITLVGTDKINEFLNNQDNIYFTNNVPLKDITYPQRKKLRYGYTNIKEKDIYHQSAYNYTFFNTNVLKEYFKSNPNKAHQFKLKLGHELLNAARMFSERYFCDNKFKDKYLMDVESNTNSNYLYNLDNFLNNTPSSQRIAMSSKQIYEKFTDNKNEKKLFSIMCNERCHSSSKNVYYFKSKDTIINKKYINTLGSIFTRSYRFDSMKSDERFDCTYDITNFNTDIFDILYKDEVIGITYINAYKNDWKFYKWLCNEFKDYVINIQLESDSKKVETTEKVTESKDLENNHIRTYSGVLSEAILENYVNEIFNNHSSRSIIANNYYTWNTQHTTINPNG